MEILKRHANKFQCLLICSLFVALFFLIAMILVQQTNDNVCNNQTPRYIHIDTQEIVNGLNFTEGNWESDQHNMFPANIPYYPVRVDHNRNETVSRGRFELLHNKEPWTYKNNDSAKVSLKEFRKVLQCARSEPTINGVRGSIDLLRMLPPTKEITTLFCAYIDLDYDEYEAYGGNRDWATCQLVVKKHMRDPTKHCRDERSEDNLQRVINGKLYKDWPWCIKNDGENEATNVAFNSLIHKVLDHVNDLRDSVFLVGAENSRMPYNKPFPYLSHSPHMAFADIPWPWFHNVLTELELYKKAKKKRDFSAATFQKAFAPHYLAWEDRVEKAIYFGNLIPTRQIFFDAALLRPDLIEARWKCDECKTTPWNPTSQEKFSDLYKSNAQQSPPLLYDQSSWDVGRANKLDRSEVGYLSPLKPLHISQGTNVEVGKYKYIVVLTGAGGFATADRFASQMAHSGAVMMLQKSEHEYHFSGRLVPWVHYVPLSYNAADVIQKVEWLQAHDDLARQIAENGRNFGLSYLRLEDTFCYAAAVLDVLGDVLQGSDALKPFNPKLITPQHNFR